ncbi:MAG: sigma-70 family RNA polymerase sigma factor [Frankiaceae bacterium]|nr:sigma-70 family RNA polymerase sigma factor [Frankiaceae bacterium]
MDAVPLTQPAHRDVELLAAAAAGRPDAVRWLLDEVAPIVHGFIWARVAGDRAAAEDLLQDTLLAAVASASSFRGDSAVSTWMCAIARHRLARHWDAERRSEVTRSRLRVVADERTDAYDEDGLLQREAVAQALGRLPVQHRQVLVLKYLDGLGVQDIAEQIGRSRVQVQSLLQRARDSLRRELAVDDD